MSNKKPTEKTTTVHEENIVNEQQMGVPTEESVESNEQVAAHIVDDMDAVAQKCAELTDKNLRLMAEFDNYRKRSLKERMELMKTASEGVLQDMLPLVDDFERANKAMANTEDLQAVRDGVDLIYAKFIAFLQQKGVKAIQASPGEVFNTDLHEAITTLPAPNQEMKGKIIDCVTVGYTLYDKVIRYSKVVVGE